LPKPPARPMQLGRLGTRRLKMATAIVTRRELERLLANRRYCNHYYAPSFRGFRHKANTLERNSFQDQFPRAPSLLPFHHPRARLLPSHRTLVRAVIDCQSFYGAAGIGAALAAGMRLSRSFALPAVPIARKSTPLGASPQTPGRPSTGFAECAGWL
jgi:hypothetical protein